MRRNLGASTSKSERPSRPAVSLRLLGTASIRFGDGSSQLVERHDAALLAMLAINGETDRAKAARFLYPDADDAKARSHLRQRLFRLRRDAPRDVISGKGTLRLCDDVVVDVRDLASALLRDPQSCSGDLLGDIDYSDIDTIDEWVAQARAKCHANKCDVLAAISSDLENRLDLVAAIRYASRLVTEDPTLEHAHRRLMKLHYLRGDGSAAMEAFKRCERVLHDDVGVRPNRETSDLAALIASGLERREGPSVASSVALLHPPRLIGRQQCRQWLAEALQVRSTLIVLGEAGQGKSRLLNEFVRDTDGAVRACARLGDERFGYSGASRLVHALVARFGLPTTPWVAGELARIAEGIARPPLSPFDPRRMLEAMQRAIGDWVSSGLSLICFDDLHYVDEASIELFAPLADDPRGTGPAFIFGTRPVASGSPVGRWIEAATAAGADSRELPPLDTAAIDEMLRSMMLPAMDFPAWAVALQSRTGGNPFFVLETLRALSENADALHHRPPSVLPRSTRIEKLIRARLAAVSPAARELIHVAAITGADYSLEAAAQVMDRSALSMAVLLRELEDAAIFQEGRFVHDLLHEEAIASIPTAAAEVFHRQVARVLEERSVAPARIAHHWRAGSAWRSAADAFVAAAVQAKATTRPVEQLALWMAAAECYDRIGETRSRFDVLCRSVTSLIAARPLREAIDLTKRLCDDATTDSERVDAFLVRATALCTAAQYREAIPLSEAAARLSKELDLPWKRFDAVRLTSMALAVTGDPQGGYAALCEFQPQIESAGRPEAEMHFWTDLGYILLSGNRRRESIDAYMKAAKLAESLGDGAELLVCRSNLASINGQIGNARLARELSSQACLSIDEGGADRGVAVAIALLNAGVDHAVLGEFDAALSRIEAGTSLMDDSGALRYLPVCHHHLCNLFTQLGQFARAKKSLVPLSLDAPELTEHRLCRAVVEARLDRSMSKEEGFRWRSALGNELLDVESYHVFRVLLQECRSLEAEIAWRESERIRLEAETAELFALAMSARIVGIAALHRGEKKHLAADLAIETYPKIHECRPLDFYWPEATLILFGAIESHPSKSRAAEADRLLHDAAVWIRDTAFPHVPAPFKQSFIERNLTNREILNEAARRFEFRIAQGSDAR